MRLILSAILATTLALPAAAQSTISAEIGAKGIGPTAERLAALPAPAPADLFALGGLRFLGGIEMALQTRWRHGLSSPMRMLPILRLPINENPRPEPFDPALIARLFLDLDTGMASARKALAEIPPNSDFGLEIDLSDLWFDINANAARDPGEDLLAVAGAMMRGPGDGAPPVIRFDGPDAAWLKAYGHALSGVAQVVLAYDPTAAITKATAASAALHGLNDVHMAPEDFNRQFGEFADIIAMVLGALDQPPDAARAKAAQAQFLGMIAENRRFWAEVALETDNDREWLPNDAQESALVGPLPAGTGATWLRVLEDGEALLTGTKLAPYWRLDDSAGVNVARMFTDPRAIDLVAWIQGADALPYLEKGPVVSAESWRDFERLIGGQGMWFALYLN